MTRLSSSSSRAKQAATTRAHARQLSEALGRIAASDHRGLPSLYAEVVEHLWGAWVTGRSKHARRYLMGLIVLQKRAATERRAADERSRRLDVGELRAHLPGLPSGKAAELRVRREVERLAKLEPRHRGRPRKGEPKPLFFAEVRRVLPALGITVVTERQLIRDYVAAREDWG